MSTVSSSRSVGAVILAVMAVIAGLVSVLDVLRFLGLLSAVTFGPLDFFGFSLFGAILSSLVAAIWFWVANKLWNQDEQGWTFVVVIAVMYLILDVVYLISGTPFWSLFPSILINVLVLIIANLPGTKDAFGRL